jgi:cyanophycin synthetase
MQILDATFLRGPNIWASFPVLEVHLDLGPWKDLSSEMIPGLNERLKAWMPTLEEHRCSIGKRGGFFQRLERGTYLAHILEHVTLELQSLAGCDVGFGKARETDVGGVYYVAVEYDEEEVAKACLDAGREICLAAAEGRDFDMAGCVSRLRELVREEMLGPSTTAIVKAAAARGIPYRRLNRESLVQLGHGARQRRVLTAETDRTGAIAQSIAQDKQLTRSLLRAIGVPVPIGRPVASSEDAWQAAQEIGLPVVVKPRYGNQGRGVATNLATREQVIAAWEAAREESQHVLVESFASGHDHRLLVIGGKLVAAALREPAHVVGDGQNSIASLIEIVNRDPRRSDGHATSLSFIKLDAVALAVLAEQGLTPESVPASGRKVMIRRNGNLSTGGEASDVTDFVHPAVAASAIAAAEMVGLDIAGVDVVVRDISQPLSQQRGAIVEVNAGPGLRMHLQPSNGKSRPVGEAIVDLLYPEGTPSRIPILAMAEFDAKGEAVLDFLRLFRSAGIDPHVCSRRVNADFRYVGGRADALARDARDLLLDPRAQAALFEISCEMILRQGLPFDRCDVAVALHIDYAGGGQRTAQRDTLLRVKRTLVEAVASEGAAIFSASEELAPELAAACRGEAIYVSTAAGDPLIREHLGEGKRAVLLDKQHVVLANKRERSTLSTAVTKHESASERLLACVAAGWALGFSEAALDEFLRSMMAI